MRVLLDECVSEVLRNYLAGHECQTARYAGFAGLENGQLLTAAEAAKFDDKLTVSGLSSALKAEKRAELAQKLAGVADVHFETELRIGRERGNNSKKHT